MNITKIIQEQNDIVFGELNKALEEEKQVVCNKCGADRPESDLNEQIYCPDCKEIALGEEKELCINIK